MGLPIQTGQASSWGRCHDIASAESVHVTDSPVVSGVGWTTVDDVLASVVFVPSAPLLVPAIAGPHADDTDPVRTATLSAGRGLAAAASRWVAIGAADPGRSGRGPSGTFARFGVDVPVNLTRTRGVCEGDPAGIDPDMPLTMLIAGWLRGETGVDEVTPVIVAPDSGPGECARIGAELRARIDAVAEPVGVLVVGDGATSMTARAPGGGLRASSIDLQQRIDDALARADRATLAGLEPAECAAEGVSGRPAWQVTAALCGDDDLDGELLFADAPFGVGYAVAVWNPR